MAWFVLGKTPRCKPRRMGHSSDSRQVSVHESMDELQPYQNGQNQSSSSWESTWNVMPLLKSLNTAHMDYTWFLRAERATTFVTEIGSRVAEGWDGRASKWMLPVVNSEVLGLVRGGMLWNGSTHAHIHKHFSFMVYMKCQLLKRRRPQCAFGSHCRSTNTKALTGPGSCSRCPGPCSPAPWFS